MWITVAVGLVVLLTVAALIRPRSRDRGDPALTVEDETLILLGERPDAGAGPSAAPDVPGLAVDPVDPPPDR